MGVRAYIGSVEPSDEDVLQTTDVLLRRLASFYTRYAKEIVDQRRAIAKGDITESSFRKVFSWQKQRNAEAITGNRNEVGGLFDIYYGIPQIESRAGIPPGRSLIISPTEAYNGCYGWLDFDLVLSPPFITVARTGSIGESFVQIEPCAPNSDCLILLPRGNTHTVADLILTTASITLEKWRYNYGRKITPGRLASVKVPQSDMLRHRVTAQYEQMIEVVKCCLTPYEKRN